MDYIYGNIDAKIIDSGDMKFKTVSATVDNNEGTPEVVVDYDYITSDLNLAFHNLRGIQGRQGETGEQGPGITNIRFNNDYTLTLTYGDGQEVTTGSIRGEKGSSGDWDPTWQVPWSQVVDEEGVQPSFATSSEMSQVERELRNTVTLDYLEGILTGYLTWLDGERVFLNKNEGITVEGLNTRLNNYYTKSETATVINNKSTDFVDPENPNKVPTNKAVIDYVNSVIEPINNRIEAIERSLRGL